jgi:hypothetical protein
VHDSNSRVLTCSRYMILACRVNDDTWTSTTLPRRLLCIGASKVTRRRKASKALQGGSHCCTGTWF